MFLSERLEGEKGNYSAQHSQMLWDCLEQSFALFCECQLGKSSDEGDELKSAYIHKSTQASWPAENLSLQNLFEYKIYLNTRRSKKCRLPL